MSTKKLSKFRAYLESYEGKTLFNYFYGFGASIAILGTLFKILHLDGANVMLAVGLGTEVLMFALSAFEPPFRAYHWEEVFPILKSHNEEDRPTFQGGVGGGVVLNGPMPQGAVGEPLVGQPAATVSEDGVHSGGTGGGTVIIGGGQPFVGGAQPVMASGQPVADMPMNGGVPAGDIDTAVIAAQAAAAAAAAANAAAMNGNAAAMNGGGGAEIPAGGYTPSGAPAATFAGAPASFPSFTAVPQDYGFPPQVHLTEEETASLEKSLKGYVEQMDNLNLNLRGLNTIYEIQLKSISSQIDTIDRVNKGLIHIKDMYEGSATDSESFKNETEMMASNLASLNQIYSRMIQAMMMPTPFMAMSQAAQNMQAAQAPSETAQASAETAPAAETMSQPSNAQ